MLATPITRLAEIAERYDVLYCDLWGCLHNGIRPFPEAVAALAAFKATGGAVVMLTNAPRPADGIADQLDAMGVPRAVWDTIVTSGDASRHEVAAGRVGRRVEHVGPPRDLPFFEGLAVERVSRAEAEGVILTGLNDDETETPEDYAAAIAEWRDRGLPVLCANPDIVVDRGDARVFCAGAIAEAFRDAGGEPLYAGKPHGPIYRLAAEHATRLRGAQARVLAVGDGIRTDILGGAMQGLDTLFVAGGIARGEVGPGADGLTAWLATQPVMPTWLIDRLA